MLPMSSHQVPNVFKSSFQSAFPIEPHDIKTLNSPTLSRLAKMKALLNFDFGSANFHLGVCPKFEK
jgi:hypothetical protein